MFPQFAPYVLDYPSAELHDFRELHIDWDDITSPGMVCYGALFSAWEKKFGHPKALIGGTEVGLPIEHPGNGMEILFAVTPSGGGWVVGAGALYNVEIISQSVDMVHVDADIIVASPIEGVAEAVEEGADGFVAVPADGIGPSLTVHLR